MRQAAVKDIVEGVGAAPGRGGRGRGRTRAHLVGSIPAADAGAAMRLAMDKLGPLLRTLPDGETGERRNWIIHLIESLRSQPDLELVKDGDWSDYDRVPRLRIRRGHRLYGATLDFGHVAAVEGSLPIFEQVRADSGRTDLAFQIGVPGDFDMAMWLFVMKRGGRVTMRLSAWACWWAWGLTIRGVDSDGEEAPGGTGA